MPLPAIKLTTPTAITPQPAPPPAATPSHHQENQQEDTDQVMLGSYFFMYKIIEH
jgi:hypothetical protein